MLIELRQALTCFVPGLPHVFAHPRRPGDERTGVMASLLAAQSCAWETWSDWMSDAGIAFHELANVGPGFELMMKTCLILNGFSGAAWDTEARAYIESEAEERMKENVDTIVFGWLQAVSLPVQLAVCAERFGNLELGMRFLDLDPHVWIQGVHHNVCVRSYIRGRLLSKLAKTAPNENERQQRTQASVALMEQAVAAASGMSMPLLAAMVRPAKPFAFS